MLLTTFWGGPALGDPLFACAVGRGFAPAVRGGQQSSEAEPTQDVARHTAKGLDLDLAVPAVSQRVRRCPGMLSNWGRDVQAPRVAGGMTPQGRDESGRGWGQAAPGWSVGGQWAAEAEG